MVIVRFGPSRALIFESVENSTSPPSHPLLSFLLPLVVWVCFPSVWLLLTLQTHGPVRPVTNSSLGEPLPGVCLSPALQFHGHVLWTPSFLSRGYHGPGLFTEPSLSISRGWVLIQPPHSTPIDCYYIVHQLHCILSSHYYTTLLWMNFLACSRHYCMYVYDATLVNVIARNDLPYRICVNVALCAAALVYGDTCVVNLNVLHLAGMCPCKCPSHRWGMACPQIFPVCLSVLSCTHLTSPFHQLSYVTLLFASGIGLTLPDTQQALIRPWSQCLLWRGPA